MNLNDLILDVKVTYGELKFFGLVRENYFYDNVTKTKTTNLESRTYKVLSMERGEELEVTVPITNKADLIVLEKLTAVELINHSFSVKGTKVKRGTFDTVELKGTFFVDDIVVANATKQTTK